MTRTLEATTSGAVAKALAAERRAAGAVTIGLVLTFVVVVDAEHVDDTVAAARAASMAHPCRVIAVVPGDPTSSARLDAEVTFGGSAGPGEAVLLRLSGPTIEHADSVVLPLLAPDTPVVTWWAGPPPEDPAGEPLGLLASRRITDTYLASDPRESLLRRSRQYQPGDTDLAWTRDTLWRSVLAAITDVQEGGVSAVTVVTEPGNPSAALLAAWFLSRTGVTPSFEAGSGPAITEVRLTVTDAGGTRRQLRLTRPDGHTAVLAVEGHLDRSLPLPIRGLGELLAEELARLHPDEPYADALAVVGRLPA